MLLKLAAAILFALITYAVGYRANKLLFGQKHGYSGFACMVLGAIGCLALLQPISFFFPLRIYWLLPALLLYAFSVDLRNSLAAELNAILHAITWQGWAIAILYLLYLVLPSLNIDSIYYHIPSTEFFHDYPVITGLANVNEQVATNSSVFLLNAPFARLFGNQQGIYPVNTVFVIAFTIWFLRHPGFSGNYFWQLVRLGLLVLCWRSWLTNLNSPSNDVLAGLLVLYVVVRLLVPDREAEYVEIKIPFLILAAVLAITAKTNCLPLALLLPLYALAVLPPGKWGRLFKLNWILPAAFILSLWVARSYLMSGFLVYPFFRAPWVHPDFALPEIQSQLEQFFLTSGPKYFNRDVPPFEPFSFSSWFPEWFLSQFTRNFNLAFPALLLALSSLVWVPLLHKRSIIPRPAFHVWLGTIFTILVWLVLSPEYRFGYGWLAACLVLLRYLPISQKRWPARPAMALAVVVLTTYYSVSGISRSLAHSHFDAQWFWRSPKTLHHQLVACKRSERPITLYNIPLFPVTGDTICLDASPWLWRYPMHGLEARGSRLSSGFRYRPHASFLQGVFPKAVYNSKSGIFTQPPPVRSPLISW